MKKPNLLRCAPRSLVRRTSAVVASPPKADPPLAGAVTSGAPRILGFLIKLAGFPVIYAAS